MRNEELPQGARATVAAPPIHPSSFILHSSFFTGVLFSYAMAMLILGAGIFAVRAWEGSGERAARSAALSPPDSANGQPSTSQQFLIVVAKITKAQDCRWADPKTAIENGADVPWGRRFALSSGRLEMTYVTGTKVVLEGPAVYEVDSDNGGYLKSGKSIFHIRRPKWRSSPNDKRPVPEWPAFAIHIPHRGAADTILLKDMDFALTVEASGLAFGQASGNVAWKVRTPGRALQRVVSPDGGMVFGVDEKGDSRVIFGHSEPVPAVAHQPPRGATIYSGEPQERRQEKQVEKGEGGESPNS
jgi:hypothetical protein